MTHRLDVAYSRAISVRWLALAEKRLKHLTELFETGRWRRYYSEHSFLENIQEAKFAVNNWRALTLGEPITPRRTGFMLTVADGEALMEPADPRARKGEKTLDELILLAPSIDTVIADSDIVVPEAIRVAEFTPAQTINRAALQATTHAEEDVEPAPVVDLDAIARRYPALRHAL
jgi:uncharacterized repeat protein (TIGR03809 family)